ncbi:hypothetical protein DW322_19890 [Rhodococcus rhodnii]|uniref:Uncharacterized protein n=2 Tax=Rhodococcus rhodnii TaxID=38312 RepID=R7WMZ9_9NOCA|nr:hypothetical protein [Rhodococcus rhodnii]EOM76701.1 hypothetical protein Rrhod_1978 [Rhodococcus rhodnii LMG 5362]TXG92020.1 hypothetical protein DW322_19890 [Rhodococcus rhodnii]
MTDDPNTRDRNTRDAEKRWDDPATASRATKFGASFLVAALLVLVVGAVLAATGSDTCPDTGSAVCHEPARTILAIGPTIVLLVGALWAFVLAYRTWRAGGRWAIWQACAWVLMVCTLMYAGLATGILLS